LAIRKRHASRALLFINRSIAVATDLEEERENLESQVTKADILQDSGQDHMAVELLKAGIQDARHRGLHRLVLKMNERLVALDPEAVYIDEEDRIDTERRFRVIQSREINDAIANRVLAIAKLTS
jgi:hypothetical protein